MDENERREFEDLLRQLPRETRVLQIAQIAGEVERAGGAVDQFTRARIVRWVDQILMKRRAA